MKKTVTALVYEDGFAAPLITAQGKGELAEKMIEIAKENGIPIVTNIDAAQVLSLYDIGDLIPEETYELIAQIFIFIRRIT